jgi:probable F420-dependent oxidoreductase
MIPAMKIGAVFPQTEFGSDPVAIKDYAQTVEGLGLAHVLAYDHVLGANPSRPGGWSGPYTHHDPFHEPFVLFSFMAALTTHLNFVTGVLILPQRQTALVAKQAAELDVLSQGRLRLGIGIGWNAVEYQALGENFHNRGQRSEEQIAVLRMLWTQPLVTFSGRWHTIQDAGINPLPLQQPIPIWIGGYADAVLERAARLADGWLPGFRTAEEAVATLDRLDSLLEAAGRSRAGFGLEPRLSYGDGDAARWARTAQGWQKVGATHLSLNTMGAGLRTPAEHISALTRMASALGI